MRQLNAQSTNRGRDLGRGAHDEAAPILGHLRNPLRLCSLA